jgi:hypothetical protein
MGKNFEGLPTAASMGASELQLFVNPDPEDGFISGAEVQQILSERFALPSHVRQAEPEDFILIVASDGAQVIVDREVWNAFGHRTAVAAWLLGLGCTVHYIFLKLGRFGAVLVPNWPPAGVNGRKLFADPSAVPADE